MIDEPMLVSVENGIKTIRITQPKSRNAVSLDFFYGAREEFDNVADTPEVGAVILVGEGEFFSSGGNLKDITKLREQSPEERASLVDALQDLARAMRNCPVPIFTAVEGGAAGAGMSLALSGDIVIAADNSFFAASYVRAGMTPDGGLTALLAESVPRQFLLEMCLTGEHVSAQRLYDVGVINRIVPAGTAEAAAQKFAALAMQGPKNAMARILELGRGAYERSFDDQLNLETKLMVESQGDPESGEGIAAVLEKRLPKFR